MKRRRFLKDAAQLGAGLGAAGISPQVTGSALALAEPGVQGTTSTLAAGRRGNSSLSLDGEWTIATDPQNIGRDKQWFNQAAAEGHTVKVPSIIQEVFPAYHGVAWYWREFTCPSHPESAGRFLMCFEAVDYLADVWINGSHVGGHEGGETPFVLDVTKAIKPQAGNLVAVRVLNPDNDPIDGIVLKQTPHRNKFVPYFSGASYDDGGIIGSVRLMLVPAVRLDDLFARPDWHTGKIRVQVGIRNASGEAQRGRLEIAVAPAATGETISSVRRDFEAPHGEAQVEVELQIQQHRLWSLEDPYLYRVTARVQTDRPGGSHEVSTRVGFRDFRVVNGYFRLNGKRVFLRSTHSGNHCPVGQVLPPERAPDLLRKDMLYAKASGFNSVRFIGIPYPYQLDLCDELGLMIMEESYADWLMEDSPKFKERWDRSTREMILRDRNHPCITIWQLLNETGDGPVFRHAVESLPLVRSLDDSRLVLLSSGRFDGDLSIGTVSNPGSAVWEPLWGKEAAGAKMTGDWTKVGHPSVVGVGDFHDYPSVPQTREANEFIRTLGHDSKPVFLSEYGIGSLMDVIREARGFEQVGARTDLEDFVLMRSMVDGLTADWKRYGMEGVYPFPEDMLADSQRRMARHRLLGFNLVRSNPHLCGFNLTGMLDHAMTGEGLWRFFRDWKPGVMDVVQDGWSPLRWCLFVDPAHVYAGRPFRLEAVLANEDVLAPGAYPARFRISGHGGKVWERSVTVNIPQASAGEEGPLAVPVLNDEATLAAPAGSYELVASLDAGGAPAGRSWQFYLSDAGSLPKLNQTVALWGVDNQVGDWLKQHGVASHLLESAPPNQREVILVGDPKSDMNGWVNLVRQIAAGSVAIFLSHEALQHDKESTAWLPLPKKGRCYRFTDHIYHKECVAKAHPIFEGLQAKAILDWYYYGQLIPHYLFDGLEKPEEVVAAAFAVGYGVPDVAPSYASGILMATWQLGEGRFILNTFPILEHVDQHPAADRMLLNFVKYAGGFTSKPPAAVPGNFEDLLKSFGYS